MVTEDSPGRTNRWRRLDRWDERPLRQDRFAVEDPEHGFCAAASPHDPQASLIVADGTVAEMDGCPAAEFDMIDRFIAAHHVDLAVAEEAMAKPASWYARALVDIAVPRTEIVRLAAGLTPARLAEIVTGMSTLELTFALAKMRARASPGNQAHVTNAKDDPLQLAADAATAGLMGFDEIETTVRVARHGWSNALACAVGAAAGRGGVLTQCSVEEAQELKLAMAGLTSYAETISVYGSEKAFIDGDDTPWSKAFLCAAYASRGVKARCTSGAGAELLMGFHERKSMLYLEARCLCVQRGMGVQGTQNGGIDGAPLAGSVPGGMWEILAENLLASVLDLECASGNDTRISASEIRVGAKIMPYLMAGTDFICSGFGSIPAYDNSFNASLFNADEIEDFLAVQRDFMVDGGIAWPGEDAIREARQRAVAAMAAVLRGLDLADPTARQCASVVDADGSRETDSFGLAEVTAISDAIAVRRLTALDAVSALAKSGFAAEAENLMTMLRQRVTGDYLQTAAILRDGRVVSAVNQPNDYRGPGSGHRLTPARRAELSRLRDELSQNQVIAEEERFARAHDSRLRLRSRGLAGRGGAANEVTIGISPAFGDPLTRTTGDVKLGEVLAALIDGIESAGGIARILRMYHTADTSFLGLSAAHLSGSGVGIGIQAKGTCVIHRADLAPHMNLELFSQAPLMRPEHYRALGANAAGYAMGRAVAPLASLYGGEALGARHHARTAILYAIDTGLIDAERKPEELAWLD
jgi:propanediol dehydratase large subunit